MKADNRDAKIKCNGCCKIHGYEHKLHAANLNASVMLPTINFHPPTNQYIQSKLVLQAGTD